MNVKEGSDKMTQIQIGKKLYARIAALINNARCFSAHKLGLTFMRYRIALTHICRKTVDYSSVAGEICCCVENMAKGKEESPPFFLCQTQSRQNCFEVRELNVAAE